MLWIKENEEEGLFEEMSYLNKECDISNCYISWFHLNDFEFNDFISIFFDPNHTNILKLPKSPKSSKVIQVLSISYNTSFLGTHLDAGEIVKKRITERCV